MNRLYRAVKYFMIVVYGPSYFVPIFYLCFGTPPPEEWIMPLQARFGLTKISNFHFLPNIFFFCFIYREPLDRHTYFGFYVLLTNLVFGGLFYFFFLISSLGFYMSLCLYTQAFVEDFQNVLSRFDQGTLEKRHTYPIMVEAIQVHSEMFK